VAKPKSAASDRQKVINDLYAKQKRKANRQGTVILTVCIVIAVLIVGVTAYKPISTWLDNQKWKGKSLDEVGAAASVCKPVTTKPAGASQQHVPETQHVKYTDAPPAFGKHWNVAGLAPAPIDQRFYTASDRPPLEALVHNLEHGYTILWYDETAAKDSDTLDTIKGIAKILDANDTNNRLSFKAVPWTSKDEDGKKFPAGEHIAFTHWTAGTDNKALGVWQYCSEPSGAALKSFMAKYPYTDAPEPIGGVQMTQ